MKLLKQSTASTVIVGPVLDANGAAVTTAVVGDFRIAKNGTTATLSGATVTHDANGYYTIALTTSPNRAACQRKRHTFVCGYHICSCGRVAV